jgi:hypothetical protein
MRSNLSCLVLLIALTGCGPFLLLPGGELEGRSASVPANWGLLEDISTVQIETRPGDPYSVNIWAVSAAAGLYIHAGDNRAAWVEHLEVDPSIRLRAGDSIYSLKAARVETQGEFDAFASAYEAKYSVRPGNEIVGEAYLFRLDAS